MFSKLSFSIRYTYFNTKSYDSRIYAYENDVLYGYSIPSLTQIVMDFFKGKKIYLLLKYNTDLTCKGKYRPLDKMYQDETIYDDRDVIKSGWDDSIEGKENKLTELKIQFRDTMLFWEEMKKLNENTR